MIKDILNNADEHMKKSEESLQHEFASVRTGRASGAILDKISVEYYGTQTPISQIAAIKSPEPQLLVIEPWDKTALGAVEKAIQASDLGLNPSNDGTVIRIPFPQPTEERRKELVKICKHYAEEARVAVRNIRRDAIERLKKTEKAGEISEDDLRRAEVDVQKLTDSRIKDIDESLKRKEEEIMEV
jgi:ribosome recycling factor